MKAKAYLYRIRLNSYGYTNSGYYYGVDQPVYCFVSADASTGLMFRARNREDAKAKVLAKHPNTEFYR